MNPAAIVLAIVADALVAYVVSSIIVAAADRLGLVWTAEKETRRHHPERFNETAHVRFDRRPSYRGGA